MKKLILLTLCLVFFNVSFSQESKNDVCTVKPFKAYIDDKDDYSNIRESPSGSIVLKLNNTYGYGYTLNIIGYEKGWLKINGISGVDAYEISNFEGWIHGSIVGAGTTHDIELLDKPNSKTKIGTLKGEQDAFKIKEVYCEWIKVDCNGLVGWVQSNKICGNPVTTCP
ncbi:hypothetical protein N9W61_01325 [Algibacter sp.]|nr:hypothetical protein [Algibacter sp.]